MERESEDDPARIASVVGRALDGMEGWLRSLAEGLIESGDIDPRGKTEEQIFKQTADIVIADPEFFEKAKFSISHEATLLVEARQYVGRDKLELAILMYATWIEHRLNLMVILAARDRGLSARECAQLVRDLGVLQKIGPAWRVLYRDAFDDQVAKDIVTVTNYRNAFVHYKWPEADLETTGVLESSAGRTVGAAERVVEALEVMYREHVLHGYDPGQGRTGGPSSEDTSP